MPLQLAIVFAPGTVVVLLHDGTGDMGGLG